MSVSNRSGGCNAYIFNANYPATGLGGLAPTDGVRNASFYSMVDIVCIFETEYFLQDESGLLIHRDGHELHPGKYYVVTGYRYPARLHDQAVGEGEYPGSITLNNEPWLVRALSPDTGTRIAAVRDAVREREGRCVKTGKVALRAEFGHWRGFEAAHVFPLAHRQHWEAYNYDRCITIPAATGPPINSVQNRLLFRSDIHQLFDGYDFSINPDVCVTGLLGSQRQMDVS
jgi:hypothetical protein